MLLELSYRFESFVNGLENHFVISRLPITHNIKELYRRFLLDHTNAEALKRFDETILIRDNILKNAQNGWVSKAELEFNVLKTSYLSQVWPEVLVLLMESQDWPLIAFIEYQKKHFSAAEISLKKGIEVDWLLESKYQFNDMLFHRIHLMHNQAKVLLRKNEIGDAIHIILNLMKQIAEPNNNIFTPPIQIKSNSISSEYTSVLFHHLCDSLAIISKDTPSEYQRIISQIEKANGNEPNQFCKIFNHILSFSHNRNANNPSVQEILSSGNLHYAGFWYSAVAILHKYCEENEPQFATAIIQKLIEKKAPSYWVQFVKSK